MSSGIYLIQNKEQLVEMNEQHYESEDMLQQFLQKYPQLLAAVLGRKLLLITSEMTININNNSQDKWSVDLMYVDQDAKPIFVQVKRCETSDKRHQIVGEIIDYVANAVNLTTEQIIAHFQAYCHAQGKDYQQVLSDFIGADIDPNEFWYKLESNWKSGKVSLIFIADYIGLELAKIVHFLSNQMNHTEVLAIEIKQFVSDGLKTIVPRIIGNTKKIVQPPKISPHKQWDETSFFEYLQQRKDAELLTVAQELYQWAKEQNLFIEWSQNSKFPAFFIALDYKGKKFKPIEVLSATSVDEINAVIQINFADLKSKPPFEDESKRMKLLYRLNDIHGINIPENKIEGYPSIYLYLFKDKVLFSAFLDTIDWVIREIKSS
jgi:hypothetical protein